MAKMISKKDIEFELRVAVRAMNMTESTSTSHERFEAQAVILVVVLGLADLHGAIDVVDKMVKADRISRIF